jgi:Arc/MetJ-type ribon-helix-helix transcriptional regulator
MTNLAIKLPDELSEFVERTVKNGAWSSAQEYVLDVLQHEMERHNPVPVDESRLNAAGKAKLAALRRDIQAGIESLDRGEGIRDFDWDAFLERKNREHEVKSAG